MNQWIGVNPKYLCPKHLNGCHAEHHKFILTWKKKFWVDRYLTNHCLEPKSYVSRHDDVAREIDRRNPGGHKSLIERPDFSYLPREQQEWRCNPEYNRMKLMNRCWDCRQAILRQKSFF